MKTQPKYGPGIANALACDLINLATVYAKAKGIKLSMAGVHVRNDQRFFVDKVPRGAFTVVAYDATVKWFNENWPATATWPAEVRRE